MTTELLYSDVETGSSDNNNQNNSSTMNSGMKMHSSHLTINMTFGISKSNI